MRRSMRFAAAALFFMVASCAVITVNIYFPEKDVKEAYKTLEKELMTPEKNGGEKQQQDSPLQKPESSLRFELVASAYAQEPGLADKISEIIKKMPEVVAAYRDMGARVGETDRLRDSGAVGEGKDGLLVSRERPLSPPEKNLIDQENANRMTVMKGMTRAIIRVNRVPETPENIKQISPQATEQFAAIRRDAAKKGWWIQDSNGNWHKK